MLTLCRNRPGVELAPVVEEVGQPSPAAPSSGLALELKSAAKGTRIESALDKFGLQKRKVCQVILYCWQAAKLIWQKELVLSTSNCQKWNPKL